MDNIASVINSVANISWPIIVIVIIFKFRPTIATIIESAKSRKFTLKIGGQELTMDEVNKQQEDLFSDIQTQLIELRKKIVGDTANANIIQPIGKRPTNRILWVDDNPKKISYFIARLEKMGIGVDIALSTSEGNSKFERAKYQYIISDMRRKEGDSYNDKAGIDLLEIIRKKESNMPFVIFCSSRGVQEYGEKAKSLGVTGITSSPTDLFAILKLDQAKNT
jgi:CheY-like chemotaxis protein